MGILSGSTAMSRYRIVPDSITVSRTPDTIRKNLERTAFRGPIPPGAAQVAGWVNLFSPYLETDFSDLCFQVAEYFLFTLRVDKKSVPPRAVAAETARAAAREAEKRGEPLNRAEMHQLSECVCERISRAAPDIPSFFDAAWREDEVLFFSASQTANYLFQERFENTFGLKLERVTPFSLAGEVLSYGDRGYAGREFLTWLLWAVECDKDGEDDALFGLEIGKSWRLADRLEDGGLTSVQGVCDMKPTTAAIRGGAVVDRLSLRTDTIDGPMSWSIDAETLALNGMKVPVRRAGKEQDEASLEGTVLLRLHFFARIQEAVDALWESFFRLRTSNEWEPTVRRIREWAA